MTTPFSTFAFPATGAPTSRTLPIRLAEIKNVRDFGAVGDGVADDWAAIMAAYNAGRDSATTNGVNTGTTIPFASVPLGVRNLISGGQRVYATDLTHPTSLNLVQIQSATATTITVQFVLGAISSGDLIQFDLVNRGTIYFPPGTYKVSQPISFSEIATSSHWLGEMVASTIVGDFNDYVLSRSLDGQEAQSGGHLIEKLAVVNNHATGGGIRLGQSVCGAIRNCIVTANKGINTANKDTRIANAYWGSLEISIENCILSPGSHATGSRGLLLLADGPVLNCRIVGFDAGLRVFGGQGAQYIAGCYFEGNGVGYQPADPDGAQDGGSDVTLSGCWFKNNSIAILDSKSAVLHAIVIEGAQGGVPGGGNPQYGIRITNGLMNFADTRGVLVSGWFDVAGIAIAGGENSNPQNTFFGVVSTNTSTTPGAVAWSLPATAMTAKLIGCNVAPVYTMAKLPPKTLTITAAIWGANAVQTIGSVAGGSGGAVGFYFNVPLTGGTGSGAKATVQVNSGGAVSLVSLVTIGSGYTSGDILSAASGDIGGVAGFSVPVTAVFNAASLTYVGGNFNGNFGSATVLNINPSGFTGFFSFAKFYTFSLLVYALTSDPGPYVSGGTALVNIISDGGEQSVWEGDCYNVSDANTATWGAVALGGGSTHAKVRWGSGGTDWTVEGK